MTVTNVPILQPPSDITGTPVPLTEDQKSLLDQFRSQQPWNNVPNDPSGHHHDHHDFESAVLASAAAKSPLASMDESPETSPQTESYWKTCFQNYCTDSTLLRYLRAHEFNLDNACKGLISTLQWRRRFKPHLINAFEELPAEVDSGKTYINGFDKQGHPILYIRNHRDSTKNYHDGIRYLVYNVEAAIRLMPAGVEKMTLIFDFNHFSASSSTPLNVSRYFLHLFGSHYPERVYRIFACDTPWYFWVFFKLMSPFMSPVTRKKIHFVDLKSMKSITPEKEGGVWSNLCNYIDPAVLEADFKGEYKFEFDPKTYRAELEAHLQAK